MIVKVCFIFLIFLYLCVWNKYREKFRFLNTITIISFLMYTCLFVSITLLNRIGTDIIETSLVPFYPYYGILTKDWNGEGFYIAQTLIGNIILFMPLGIVFSLLFKGKKKIILMVVFCAFVISLSIEVMQYSFRLGTFEVDDLIHNTLGAVFGSLIAESIKLIELHNKQTYQLAAKKLKPLFMFLLFFGIVCFISVIHLCIVRAF